jgi:transcriptional regulator with XRE-family HTH domain
MFKPDPIDIRLGELLRLARNAIGMSQEKLGAMNELTFQQIQKYERGHNRVSVSRLMHMAENLGVPATWFVEKLRDNATAKKHISEFDFAVLNQREVRELLRSYADISDKDHRRFLRHTVELFATSDARQKKKAAEKRAAL